MTKAKPEAAPATVEPAKGMVWVTVTKKGDGMVSTGVHVSGSGDVFAERGDRMLVTTETAASLEDKAYAEAD